MSQDGKTNVILTGQTVGFVTIAVGFALIIATYMAQDFWLIIPVTLIEVGFYGLAMGAFGELRGGPTGAGRFKWGNDPAYTMFWGSLLVLIGTLWLVNAAWPDNLPALAAAFLIWFGVAVMLLSRKGTARTRIW